MRRNPNPSTIKDPALDSNTTSFNCTNRYLAPTRKLLCSPHGLGNGKKAAKLMEKMMANY